jgi:outer membrane immunogenic protein
MDLGHLDTTGVITGASATGACTPCAITAGQATTHTHFTDWILRAGVNYQFH